MPLPMAYEFPSGLTLVGAYAMAAQRHMHQYGTTAEQLASISVQTREHAARNPNAMYRDPITVDDVLSSRLVADPLHKLDCCVISDGGCCIILTTEDRARDLAHRPVYVRGAAGGTTHHSIQAMADMTRTAAAVSGPKAFAEAGITPADVDMFAMYDSFTYTVLVVLEDLGFAPKGEGGAFVTDGGGNLRLGGALPTNTDGGGLSATHPGMRGLFLLCEATRQLRGEAGDSQVPGAEIAVAHGSGGWLSTQATVVLGTEPRIDDDGDFVAHNGVDWSESPKYLWPRPNHEDREFWEGARRGELRIQRCTSCGKHQHYPRFLCIALREVDARVGHRERARDRLLVHRRAPERRAAVQRAGAVRRRGRRSRRGRARA